MNSLQRKHNKQDKHDLKFNLEFDRATKAYSEKDKFKLIDKVLLGIGLFGLLLYSLEQLWVLIYEWDMLW